MATYNQNKVSLSQIVFGVPSGSGAIDIRDNTQAFTETVVDGLYIGDGFLDTLLAPNSVKDAVVSESRLEHGRRAVIPDARYSHREMTLTFIISTATVESFKASQTAFYNILYRGYFYIKIPKISNDKYYLRYTGNSVSYAYSPSGTLCKISAKFSEDNPNKRS